MSTESILAPLLAPVARFCIRRSFHFGQLVEAFKESFIRAAVEDIEGHGSKVTISQIALLTGITRREVQRIYREGKRWEKGAALTARVLNRWQEDRRFLSRTGTPRSLSYGSDRSEFYKLCELVTSDINPGTILRELLRLKLVEITEDGVRPMEQVSFLHTAPEKGINLLLRDIDTLSCAVEENLEQKKEVRNLHLRTEFDNIEPSRIPEIRSWLLEQGAALHRAARELLSKYDRDVNPNTVSKGGARVVLGTFSWTQDEEAEQLIQEQSDAAGDRDRR